MTLKKLGLLTALLATIVLVGYAEDSAYRDFVRERENYCHMVRKGYWPDYREIYATECQLLGPLRPIAASPRVAR